MINFTPGPSQLYFTVEAHLRQAMRENIGSLSHRSKEFETICKSTTDALRELLGIPAGHHIFFTGSATEIWERVAQNLVEKHSFHFVNGAFSKRFYEIAAQCGKHPEKIEAAPGNGFPSGTKIPVHAEVLAVTHNETSTGVMLPPEFIHGLKDAHPDTLLVIDAVSSLPYPVFDYTKVDSVFFSVQKGFGMPAGLGVWVVNDHCIEKANAIAAKGISIGSYHNLPTLLANAKKNQTPETPNVLWIWLLGKIANDMLVKGGDRIRKEAEYKAATLYYALERHPFLKPVVKEEEFQSKTVITVDCGSHVDRVTKALNSKGMQPGDGYGEFRKTQLRFANFPTHSKEQFELLVDTLASIKV